MRADVVRHRTQLIEAAARVFARDGADAPLEAVLVEAGLGRGTLYRHFPRREALLVAALEREIEDTAAFMAAAPRADDFLVQFLRRMSRTAMLYTGAFQRIDMTSIESLLPALSDRVRGCYAEALAIAQAAGQLKPDVTVTELMLVPRMIAGGTQFGSAEENAFELALGIILRGLAVTEAP